MLERCVAIALQKHDDAFVYELPYVEGRTFRVLQGYGGRYSHSGNSHYSVDFRMRTGTPICAARSGVVLVTIDEYREGGRDPAYRGKANRIEILHEDGTVASYLHLVRNGVLVQAGEPVSTGQVVGVSGNTGWSSQPHLHFDVAGPNGAAVPTRFRTSEYGTIFLEEGKWYTKPSSRHAEEADKAFRRILFAVRVPVVRLLNRWCG